VLTAPFTPMLFMGEEWAASTPWQYFTDHTDPALATAVADGRRAEFGAHGWGPAEVPNPQDPETFLRSRLDWAEVSTPRHQEMLAWYTELIALRRAWPELTDPQLDRMDADFDEEQRWLVLHRGRLRIVASLGEQPRLVPLGGPGTTVLAASSSGVSIQGDHLSMPLASFAVVAT
jgi:maltooligosyltrehalose trehalohydrolase